MFTVIEDFYSPSELGLMSLYFMNLPLLESYQSKAWKVSDRFQAYPCYESEIIPKSDEKNHPYKIFKDTFEQKTNLKPILINTYFRKIKLEELKKSAVYKKDRPHKDDDTFDYAGVVYFNSHSIKDGTKIYNDERDFEPSVIIGSKVNRCVFYDSEQPHSAPYDQNVEERWIQPFFLITNESTYKKYKNYET
jgi:hypothetical protein|tara:strand:- start:239 stop:814 length:576 start_codon:yes stop_codon:yes gene_type:complete